METILFLTSMAFTTSFSYAKIIIKILQEWSHQSDVSEPDPQSCESLDLFPKLFRKQ